MQNARHAHNKLNVFDLLALFRASQGESQRHTDELTLRKLTNEGLLISAQDGYKLSERYYDMAKNVGTVENTPKDDTVNVPVNGTVKLSQLTERQYRIYEAIKNIPVNVPNLASMLGVSEKTIKRDIAAMQSAGFIKRIGSDKTGHWEVIDNVK